MSIIKPLHVLFWVLRLAAAVIMLQTLFFKFSGSEESVYIFSTLGMEPWGRIGTGVFELIASILLLWPRTTAFGALLGIGLMSGAIFFHLTTLGIEIKGDGGLLFLYAVIVLICSAVLLYVYQDQIRKVLLKTITQKQ
ncbi:MAG: DoxX family protein [Chitinophagaceae bacterium]|jgi:putative oxidoreductase|nr:DoxX family protein [Chitinophagaceae bacterium]